MIFFLGGGGGGGGLSLTGRKDLGTPSQLDASAIPWVYMWN